jgi:HAMP domain-containing protein
VKLRTRFALLMVVCALVPLLGAGLLARSVLTRRYEQADTRRRTAAVARVERTLESRASAQQRTLARFCAHDYLVDRTLLQLETGQFSETARAELGALLPEVRAALGFDVLSLVRGDGVVLASAHYPGQAGSRDAETFRLATRREGDERWVRKVRVRDRDGPRDRLVLESSCVRRRGGVAVAVSGGEAVDGRLLQDLAGDEGVSTRLVFGDASELGASGDFRRVLPLRGPGGEVVAAVVVESSDRELRELVAELDTIAGVSSLLAVLLASLLAVLLALLLARPIDEVAAAADRIAKGDRSVQIAVKSGGEVGRLVAAFNHMTPFPATPLYERLKCEGRLRYEAWWLDPAYRYNEVPYFPSKLSPTEVTQGCVAARRRFYGWSSIARRIRRNHSNFFMLRNYLPINYMHRREISLRNGYPLGDEAYPEPLLEVA